MLFVTLFAVLMSALGGMLRAAAGEKIALPHSFLFLAIAAPVGMAIVISLVRAIAEKRRRK